MRHVAFALALLLAGLGWNNAWKWVDDAHAGHVWSASGGAFIALLLAVIVLVWGHWAVTLVCLLLIGFALQAFACNLWFVLEPWVKPAGGELCSSRLGVPLGLVGVWAASLVAQYVYTRGKHG
jgi:hypothetical protein